MTFLFSRSTTLFAGVLLSTAISLAAEKLYAASPPVNPAVARSAAVETPEQLQARIAHLIEQLGDKQYLMRQAAQDELARIGPDAFDALTQAENNSDIEICSRAKYLVQQIRIEFVSETDSQQVKQILRDYDRGDDDRRLRKMQELAMLPGDIGLPALCRLVRFEKSPLLSKHGAMLILGQPATTAARAAARARSIELNLASCTRPGAQWLRAYLQFCREPGKGAAGWENFVRDEVVSIESISDFDSDSVLLMEQRLARFLEQKLNRHDLAMELMSRMLAQEVGDPITLKSLVDWYVQCQAWDLVDEASRRFEHVFAGDPLLLYTAAHSRRAQGQNKAADELAEKAFQLAPTDPGQHFDTARLLMKRGIFDYAEREFRHVIAKAPPETNAAIDAQLDLAEMLHDQEQDLAAAEALRPLVLLIETDADVKRRLAALSRIFIPAARMHFFYACDAAAKNQLEEQRKHLDEAVVQDPKDADVLIALYKSSQGNPARRDRALKFIRDADEKFRAEISQEQTSIVASMYNEVAWLLGNTVGDFDAAIKYSQRSLEVLDSEEGGFIDTLAHCYAGKGDFESAVKYQTRARELDPHAKQISRALARFSEQLAKSNREMP